MLVATIFPALPEGAHAEEPATATPRAIEDPTVSLSVPATIEFADVMATPSGATTTASATIGVTTTASAGYKLYLYAKDNSLKSLNPNTTQSIASASASSLDSFTNNTWGYNLTEGTTAGTTYSALPITNTTPTQTKDTSDTNSANDTYTLSLGAKVDSTIPSGTYTATMTVAVVAEPGGIPITYDANGGYYNGDSSQTTQQVSYNVSAGKIAKTSNISDDGVQSGGYGDDVEETQTVTIPGAESLQVTVSYQTESTNYDWLAIYDGSVTPSATNYGESITGKLGGRTKVDNAVFIIPGDTAQFYFRSDGSGSNYYGYYAVVQEVPTMTPSVEVLTPTRPGYVFWGWYKDAAGTKGEEFTVDDSLQAGTVYAKWLLDVGPIQDFTNAQCQSLASTPDVAATDRRDSNIYTVRYIKDACWMTSNLRLSGGRTLTPSDSNVDSNWTFLNNSLDKDGTNYIGNSYTEAGFVISDDPQHAAEYGGYYNYCAASAGSVCEETKMDAIQSICPKGWRLPTLNEMNGITSYVSAFSPVLSGYYNYGTPSGTGSRGYWWSATAYDSSFQYNLRYGSGSLYTSYDDKRLGISVRCIRSS